MNDFALSFLLGVIEGLTEFLPVSSTAHLRITEALLGIDLGSGYWKMFSIVIQLGAILTLPIYFRARIAEFLRSFPRGARKDRTVLRHPLTLTLLAFVCTAVPSLLMVKLIGKHLESLWVMATSLAAGGAIMWIVDVLYERHTLRRRTNDMQDMTLGQAVWIGVCQVLSAVFPGTSRSMATIAAGQVAGMSRAAALEFSFFLSMPTMAAATVYDFVKSLRHPAAEGGSAIGAAPAGLHGWVTLAIGFVVSFIVAYGVVAWFMHWVRHRGFVPFAIYRIAAGLALVGWLLTRG